MQKLTKGSPVLASLLISLTLAACAKGPETQNAGAPPPTPPQVRGIDGQAPSHSPSSAPSGTGNPSDGPGTVWTPPPTQPPFPPVGRHPQPTTPAPRPAPGQPTAPRPQAEGSPDRPQVLTDLMHVGVKIDGDLDGEREAIRFNALMAHLKANQPALQSLIEKQVLKKIWFSSSNPDSHFEKQDGTLYIATEEPGLHLLTWVLQALAMQYDMASRLGIPIVVSGAGTLDQNYLMSMSLLQSSFLEIATKTRSIHRITLGSSRTFFSRTPRGNLYIGYRDSALVLERVLSWIP